MDEEQGLLRMPHDLPTIKTIDEARLALKKD